MPDRRRHSPPIDADGYLQQLPALQLLNRLPAPMLGIGLLGDVGYANPACADLLGYPDAEAMTLLQLPELLADHERLAPPDCVATLRGADGVIGWNHAEGYVVRTMVSPPLLVRATDALLLVSITDVTAALWEKGSGVDAIKRAVLSP